MSGYKPLSAGARQAKLLSRIGAETNKNELLEAQVLLRRAIGNELTDRQHLQKASARLSRALQYSALGMRAEQSRDR